MPSVSQVLKEDMLTLFDVTRKFVILSCFVKGVNV